MYQSISQFLKDYSEESRLTQLLFDSLTNKSLHQAVSPQDRTLGRVAWHLVLTLASVMNEVGITMESVKPESPLPDEAAQIASTYRLASAEFIRIAEKNWRDPNLRDIVKLFGIKFSRSTFLYYLVRHEVHHRGQMTILMRQAGLIVPFTYGPTREYWGTKQLPEPAI